MAATAQTIQPEMGSEEAVRQERGRLIAQRMRITRKAPDVFVVPSSKPQGAGNPGSYTVETGAKGERCNCPDYDLRGAVMRCKHLWAVEYSRRSETMADGSTKTVETMRVTYAQDWSAYNAAQRREKEHVVELLASLCDGLPADPPMPKGGHPRLPLRDRAFAVTMKVYGGMSARRTETDLREYAAKGHLSRAPSYNAVIDYFDDPAMTPILRQLIEESAAPLATVETTFAPDSSGFSTCQYVRWFDEKYGREQSHKDWIKAHIMVGCKTNVITFAAVTDKTGNDAPQLPALLNATCDRFTPHEVVADKGYLSHANQQAIVSAGATPYIPFKSNSVAVTKSHKYRTRDTRLWRKLFHFFQFQREDFLARYNARSNVESTFSGVKRVFGATLRSKTRVGQENELLAKLLCWNLSCLVHEIYELGINPMFWPDAANDNPEDDLPAPLPAARQLAMLPGNPRSSEG